MRRSLVPSRPRNIPWDLPYLPGPATGALYGMPARLFSTSGRQLGHQEDKAGKADDADGAVPATAKPSDGGAQPRLTHVSPSGAAHMVSISAKAVMSRVAMAACAVVFSDQTAVRLIRENQMKKGDVLGVARVAGIMAAKRTSDLIPLCHPIPISRVSVELEALEGGSRSRRSPTAVVDAEAPEAPPGPRVEISATVECDGKTGVEMEALTAAGAAALTVYDMCKAVDKGMRVEGLRVVLKDGGKSGRWVEGLPGTPQDGI